MSDAPHGSTPHRGALSLGNRWIRAKTRYRSLQQFFRYLVEEGEIRVNPMANTKPPAVPEDPPPVLTDEQLRRLLAACAGAGFAERRDLALLRVLVDSGMRLAELAGLRLADIDLEERSAVVIGKGRRPRFCPLGPKTVAALDRYLRVRATHREAGREQLWLGRSSVPMTGSGIRQVVQGRARQASIGHIHPHLFRHTFAHRWLAQGGQETDLMRLAGWRSRVMLSRYGASAADERAREAHRRLAIGERV